jgi:hypothetical protein
MTLGPAHSATCVGGTPAFNHVERAAWRRSKGRLASGEAYSTLVKAAARAARPGVRSNHHGLTRIARHATVPAW